MIKDNIRSTVFSTMKLLNRDCEIAIYHEWDDDRKHYKTYTDSLKYGNKLEIIFSNDRNCFVIKNIESIKKQWNKDHGISSDPFDKLLELDNGMQDL